MGTRKTEGEGRRRALWGVKVSEDLALLMSLAEEATGKSRSDIVREAVMAAHPDLLRKARAILADRKAAEHRKCAEELERIRDALVKPDDARSVERRSSRRASSTNPSSA